MVEVSILAVFPLLAKPPFDVASNRAASSSILAGKMSPP
eukprot:CAMPEP_0117058666 /NCGR_PEP_ID=MMETSP0472-20121206/40755_1 /TAXON_ID=693140 ORGANISM="Tiarina fusus, Strain LIS" /NCGR_SAMPLE_ID=MMETSP0472 /ASSEMBLY_ACC=CAM_ASM_000603 /LENGTH=38 /DNA_ID= /DNA_START= /DNA_END= /DNA_ORIENTATION=